MRKIILFWFTTLVVINGIHAQESAIDYNIHFKSLTMVPEPNAMEYLSSFEANTEQSYQGQIFKIVQFYQTPGQEEKEILRNAGIELLDYLPERAYFAALSNELDISLVKNMGVRSIADVAPDFKLARLLFQENYPGYAIQEDGKIRLMISYYPNLDPSQVIASLAGEGFKVETRDDFGKFVGISVKKFTDVLKAVVDSNRRLNTRNRHIRNFIFKLLCIS